MGTRDGESPAEGEQVSQGGHRCLPMGSAGGARLIQPRGPKRGRPGPLGVRLEGRRSALWVRRAG